MYTGKTESDNTLHCSSVFHIDQYLVHVCSFSTQRTSRTSGVMEYIICLLTTCRITAAVDSATFLQLSRCLKAASSTSAPGAVPNADKTELLWFGPAGIAAASAAISEQYHPRQPVRH